MNTALHIAWKEFTDRFRSGWVLACVCVWLGAIVLTSAFALVQIGRIGVQGYDRTVVSLLSLVQYVVPLLALLLGHDLIVHEREERTLALLLASGISRGRVLLGKFLGGAAALAVPLVAGFVIAGIVIGRAAQDRDYGSFLVLAASGLGLGIVFVAVGLAISSLCRTRVQALVAALLTWCVVVFAFDLIALGWLVHARAPIAASEIDAFCDPMHVATAADLHAAYEAPTSQRSGHLRRSREASLRWLLLNPVDLFRAANLSRRMDVQFPATLATCGVAAWIALSLGVGWWRLRRVDV